MATAAPRQAAFSVVSGTTLRFVSLVAAILGTSSYAFSLVYIRVPGNQKAATFTYGHCLDLVRRAEASLTFSPTATAEFERLRADAGRCLAPFEQTEAAWLLAGLGLLTTVALLLYLAAPWWIRRRGNLRPVTAAEFPRLHAALDELAEEIGLSRKPSFVLDANAPSPGGLAFGRTGRYWVRINAGLVPLRVTDPATFRAIVLHELAHLRNRDVDIAYAAMALWRAFVLVVLPPMLLIILHPTVLTAPTTVAWSLEHLSLAAGIMSRTLLFVLIVYLARNAVLRTREIHADVRAAEHGAADGLRRAMSSAAKRPRTWWRPWFGTHPATAARLHAIDQPLGVLRPGFGELFGAGVTAMIAAGSLEVLANLGLSHGGTPPGRYVAWAVAPLFVGILGAVVWRAEVLSAHGTRVPTLPAVLGFSLGCIVGDIAALISVDDRWSTFGSPDAGGRLPLISSIETGGISLAAGLIGTSVLTAGLLVQAAASAAGARAWLPTLRWPGTRRAWAAGVAVTMIPFAIWFGIWLQLRLVPLFMGHVYHLTVDDFAAVGEQLWAGPGFALWSTTYPPIQLFTNHPLAVPAVALAWLYPFAALARRRSGPADAATPAARPDLPTLRDLRRAALTGLAGVAVFGVLVLAGRAVAHHFAYDKPGFPGYYSYSLVALAIAIQAVIGGVLAARHPRGLLLGQPAALLFAAGAIAVAQGAALLGGCVPAFRLRSGSCRLTIDLAFADFLMDLFVVQGALAALLVGVLTRLVMAASRKLPARIAPRRRWIRSVALAGAVAVLVSGSLAVLTTRSATLTPAADGNTAPPSAAPVRRLLTQAEVEQVTAAPAAALPGHWRRKPPSASSGGGTTTVLDDPEHCTAVYEESYLSAFDGQRRAVAQATFDEGMKPANSTLFITVRSYAQPVPEALFAAAEAARSACPRFTATAGDDPPFDYTIRAGVPPDLGDRAWRMDLVMAAELSGITFTGTLAVVLIQVGHTLIQVTFNAFNEPVDEKLFLAALTRIVQSVP